MLFRSTFWWTFYFLHLLQQSQSSWSASNPASIYFLSWKWMNISILFSVFWQTTKTVMDVGRVPFNEIKINYGELWPDNHPNSLHQICGWEFWKYWEWAADLSSRQYIYNTNVVFMKANLTETAHSQFILIHSFRGVIYTKYSVKKFQDWCLPIVQNWLQSFSPE